MESNGKVDNGTGDQLLFARLKDQALASLFIPHWTDGAVCLTVKPFNKEVAVG
jgi:hypothetical protein